ncbi:MAG: TIGR03943 family protein [Clostridium sp.]
MFLLATYFLLLLINSKLHLFIHPKMFKYVFIAMIILYVLCFFQSALFTENKRKKESYLGFLLFLIILFFAYVVRPYGVNSNFINSRLIDIHDNNKELTLYNMGTEEHHIHEENTKDGSEFLEALKKIYKELSLQGETLKLRGVIYKDNSMKDKEFILGRMILSCCAADAQFVGFICENNTGIDIIKEQWVEVQGEIDYEVNEKGELYPRLIINNIRLLKGSEGEDKYIYN